MNGEIESWARGVLNLDPAATVTVSEKESNDPRCSPVVTEVHVESPGETPYSFHIERPPHEVTEMDVMAAVAFGGH